MAFTSIPSADIQVGKPVRQSLMQLVKDNFDDLNTRMTSLTSGMIPNGSFEVDSDNDGIPDNWTRYLYSGGSMSIETTAPAHGAKAIKFTQTTSSGGGYLESDYVPCSEYGYINIRAMHKSSVAGIDNCIQILYYTTTKAYISSAWVYDSTSNPTSWTEIIRTVLPVANARFCKIRVFGGYPSATTGSAWWDNVTVDFFRADNYFAQTSGSMAYPLTGTSLSVGSKTMTAYQDSAVVMDIDLAGGQAITATINGCAKTCSITPPLGRWTAIASANWTDSYSTEGGDYPGYWNISLLLIRQA